MLKKAYSKTKPVCKVTFSLPIEAAPDAEKVFVLGDFNDWNAQEAPEMKKTQSHFEATIELAAGRRYEFRYLIDGKRWENDWDADGYEPSPFAGIANSIIVLDAVSVKPAAADPAEKPAAKKQSKPAAKAAPAAKPVEKAPAKPAPVAKPAAKPAAKAQPKTTAKPVKTAKDNPKGGKK